MKKIILLMGCILAYITSYCQKEDTIFIYNDVITKPSGDVYLNYAQHDISILNPTAPSPMPMTPTSFILRKSAIAQLQDSAYNFGPSPLPNGGYVTAIEMKFGVSSSYSLELFIRPFYLVRSNPSIVGNEKNYAYTSPPVGSSLRDENSSANPYYILNGDGSITMDNGQTGGSIKNLIDGQRYKQSIRISHYYGDAVGTYNCVPYDDSLIIYSFQELDTLLSVNKRQNSATPDSLILLNAGYPIHKDMSIGAPYSYPVIRHSILLSPYLLDTSPSIPMAFPPNEYADLGNLCPPECPNNGMGVIFTLSSKVK